MMDGIYVRLPLFVGVVAITIAALISTLLISRKMRNVKLKLNDIEEGRIIGDNKWKTYLKRMVICGTYQRTYSASKTATYAEKKGFPPTSLRHPVIYLKPQADGGVDIKIET